MFGRIAPMTFLARSALLSLTVFIAIWAHRFATGLPCRASSPADGAMLAALRVAVGMGCGSRPSGRASLARAGAARRLSVALARARICPGQWPASRCNGQRRSSWPRSIFATGKRAGRGPHENGEGRASGTGGTGDRPGLSRPVPAAGREHGRGRCFGMIDLVEFHPCRSCGKPPAPPRSAQLGASRAAWKLHREEFCPFAARCVQFVG